MQGRVTHIDNIIAGSSNNQETGAHFTVEYGPGPNVATGWATTARGSFPNVDRASVAAMMAILAAYTTGALLGPGRTLQITFTDASNDQINGVTDLRIV